MALSRSVKPQWSWVVLQLAYGGPQSSVASGTGALGGTQPVCGVLMGHEALDDFHSSVGLFVSQWTWVVLSWPMWPSWPGWEGSTGCSGCI